MSILLGVLRISRVATMTLRVQTRQEQEIQGMQGFWIGNRTEILPGKQWKPFVRGPRTARIQRFQFFQLSHRGNVLQTSSRRALGPCRDPGSRLSTQPSNISPTQYCRILECTWIEVPCIHQECQYCYMRAVAAEQPVPAPFTAA